MKHWNYIDMHSFRKTFEGDKTCLSLKNSFPLKILLKLLLQIFLLSSFVCSICSLFIRIKMFDFEIDKEIGFCQHIPLFLYIPLS